MTPKTQIPQVHRKPFVGSLTAKLAATLRATPTMMLAVATCLSSTSAEAQEAVPLNASPSGVSSGASLNAPSSTPSNAATPTPSAAIRTGKIEGVVFEKGTKKPLPTVNVFVLPAKVKSTTDEKGRFSVEGVPEGEIQLVVNASGYRRLDRAERVEPSSTKSVRLLLERDTYQGFTETVIGKVNKRDDTTRTLKTEQFLTMPGANGDPVKAVQNLPGVARAGGFSSQVIIQGSAPQDTSYLLDDHEVPLVFHFGGLTSVITPEAVDQVDYLSAGYGPEYGRAMGGLVGLRTRPPATDRLKGFAFADITKAGGLIEGPIDDKSSFLFTARYSYVGFVLKQIAKGNDRFDLTVAPAFGDVTTIYNRKISEADEIKVVALASHDELKFLLKEPLREDPSIRGNFSNETTFYRLVPQWTHRFDSDTTGRLSFGVGQDFQHVDIGDNYVDIKQTAVTQRAELEKKVVKEWTGFWGLDNRFSRATVSLRVPTMSNGGGVGTPIATSDPVTLDTTQSSVDLAPYWRNTIKPGGSKWTYMPSLRADYFSLTKELKPAPRLAARYDQSDSLFYKAATGLYYQPPEPQETAPDYGNPEVKAPYAWHFTAGAEKDFKNGTSDGFVVQSTLFYRLFENLVVSSDKLIERNGSLVFERYNNDGRGRAYGLEMMIRYDKKPWSGWLAYTLSRSYREEPGQGEHLFRYDQTHNINLVGSVDLSGNWKLSGRARYVTGNPVTPVLGGTFDADSDVYVPRRGAFYSERLEPFFQLDFRADKKWVFDDWILWGYLDVQNITNNQNPEAVRYSYDYSQKRTITGLPTLPTIGVRGEF